MNDNHVITQAADHLGNAFFSNPQLCGEKWDLAVGSVAILGVLGKGGGAVESRVWGNFCVCLYVFESLWQKMNVSERNGVRQRLKERQVWLAQSRVSCLPACGCISDSCKGELSSSAACVRRCRYKCLLFHSACTYAVPLVAPDPQTVT